MRRILPGVLVAITFTACVEAPPDPEDLGADPAALTLTPLDCALKNNEKGEWDTQTTFASFWDSSFTMMAWIAPEYVFAGNQPVFGSETGSFALEVGDFNADWDNSWGCSSTPILELVVFGQVYAYHAPTLAEGHWSQVAMTWNRAPTASAAVVHVYVDGQEVLPFVNISTDDGDDDHSECSDGFQSNLLPAAMTSTAVPSGTLRIGRANRRHFYGLVDDGRVYGSALSPADLAGVRGGGGPRWTNRITFDELQCGWSDPHLIAPSERIALGAVRDDADGAIFDDPAHLAPTDRAYHLPFHPGELWQVVQPFDAPGANTSHHGDSAFSWDFVRPSQLGVTAGARIVAAASGSIVDVRDDHVPLPNEPREENYVRTLTSPDRETTSHLHMMTGSFHEISLGGDANALVPTGGVGAIAVADGDEIARVGMKAAHLHFGLRRTYGEAWTIPMAFVNYERLVSCTTGHVRHSLPPPGELFCFEPVARGMPADGELVRRPL